MVVRVRVEIGVLVFKSVTYAECKKSIKNLTGTAIVKLPKKMKFISNAKPNTRYEPNKSIKDYIKVGDPVTIYMGYDDKLIKRFQGYVSRGLKPSIPIVIECEDEMYKLKQKEVSVSIENATIKQIIQQIAPEYETEVLDGEKGEIGDFSEKKTTATKVLFQLKKRFGIYSYFIGKKLIVGKPYTNNEVINTPIKIYDFSKNIIKSDLTYVDPKDYKVQINAISINADNSRTKVTVGDLTGGIRDVHYGFDKTKNQLKTLALKDLDKFKKRGLDGSLLSFGFPVVNVGNKIQIIDKYYDKRNSKHFVDEVKEWIGKGYRREITIGLKAEK